MLEYELDLKLRITADGRVRATVGKDDREHDISVLSTSELAVLVFTLAALASRFLAVDDVDRYATLQLARKVIESLPKHRRQLVLTVSDERLAREVARSTEAHVIRLQQP